MDGGGTSTLGVQTAMEAAAEPLNLWLFKKTVSMKDFANTGGSIGRLMTHCLRISKKVPWSFTSKQLDSGRRGWSDCLLDGHGVRVRKNLPSSSGVVLESVETISGLSRQKDESANTSLKGLSIEIWGDFRRQTIIDRHRSLGRLCRSVVRIMLKEVHLLATYVTAILGLMLVFGFDRNPGNNYN